MPLADTLLRLAEPPGLYRPRWTDQILAEVTRTLVRRFWKSAEQARYRETAMREFFADSLVTGYEMQISKLTNDPKDRHVLAAAIRCKADFLVTFNLKHFPAEAGGVRSVGPSTFLKMLVRQDRGLVTQRLIDQALALGEPVNKLLERLSMVVPKFVSEFQTGE